MPWRWRRDRAAGVALIWACGAMLGVAHVIGGQMQGIWLTALIARRGLPPSILPLAPTVLYLCAALAGELVGRALDRDWTRAVLVTGALALSGGALVLGVSAHVWQVSIGFGCLGAGFACLGHVTFGKLLAREFHGPARRHAMGLATLGPSLGAFLVWLAAESLAHVGLRATGVLLAALVVGVMGPLLRVLTRPPPRLTPPGSLGRTPVREPTPPWTLREAMHTTQWWALAVALSLVVFAQTGYIIYAVPLYAETFGLSGAGGLWTVSCLLGTGARLAYAAGTCPHSTRQIAAGVYLVEALGTLLLALGRPAFLLLGAALMGATASLTVTLEPHLATDTFEETRAYGVLYGRIYRWARLAAALGAAGAGWLVTATGGYFLPLTLMGLCLLVAALSIRWATPLGKAARPRTRTPPTQG